MAIGVQTDMATPALARYLAHQLLQLKPTREFCSVRFKNAGSRFPLFFACRFGSEELKQQFLRPTIAGDVVACLGVSEVGAGSDVSSMSYLFIFLIEMSHGV